MAKQPTSAKQKPARKKPTPKAPPPPSSDGSDIEAMVDMATAFGHGVRKHDPGRDWSWSENTVFLGALFMTNRLLKKPGNYWKVRDKALRRAYEVGQATAKLVVKGDAHITYDHLATALRNFGPFGPGRDDCPFD